MTLQTVVGSMALAEVHLRNLLADSPQFRQWCGAEQAVQARNKVHYGIIPPPADGLKYTVAELNALRPYVIISTPKVRLTRTSPNSYKDRGELYLRFAESIPPEWYDDPGRAEVSFKITIGGLMAELMTYAIDDPGAGPYLVIDEILMEDEPRRAPEDVRLTDGDHHVLDVTVHWGGDAED